MGRIPSVALLPSDVTVMIIHFAYTSQTESTVYGMSLMTLRRADYSSRGILPTVVRRCV
jgi:hypothetical protein